MADLRTCRIAVPATRRGPTSPGGRQEVRDMAAKHRRPCWDNVERVIRLLISVADEVARLMDVFRIR
jgi:hypothetical protein